MAYRVIFHPEAEAELYESVIWYEEILNGLGGEFLKEVEKITHHLNLHPFIYSKRKKNYREAVLRKFPFIVVYKINSRNKEVHILSVFHTSQNQKKKHTRH